MGNPNTYLIAIDRGEWPVDNSLNELADLISSIGLVDCGRWVQKRDHPDRGYLGSGKLDELKRAITESDPPVEVVVADDELSPSVQKYLESRLQVRILDRTSVILEIFAKRAKTYEAQLQVELAQLEYLKPRLTRLWQHLSRLGGGVGTRGPGESQLETDKRLIQTRISVIKRELTTVTQSRSVQRAKRKRIPVPTGAIVGYTNAGKSTLLNTLTAASVLAEDRLFATLDPTTRKLFLPHHQSVLVTDTVGFIQKLPHHLVSSFRATLEEVNQADFLVHVLDGSASQWENQWRASMDILHALGVAQKPTLTILNKADAFSMTSEVADWMAAHPPALLISGTSPKCIEPVTTAISEMLNANREFVTFEFPYCHGNLISTLFSNADVSEIKYAEDHISVSAHVTLAMKTQILGRNR